MTAAVIRLETELADAALLMFDKLMGGLARKSERRTMESAAGALRDGGRDQSQAARPVLLRFGSAVAQTPEPVKADGASERVSGLAFVQRHGGLAAQAGLFEPIQRVEGALDSADLAGQPPSRSAADNCRGASTLATR